MKLHKQFSHPRSHKLKKLLMFIDGSVDDKEFVDMIENIEKHCTVCTKYKCPPAKPIVTFPLASEFNESVAIDLKQVSGKLVLHLIDHATRFSSAGVIPSKDRDVIISKIFQIWTSIFGPPKHILSGNGGESANEDFRIMAEKLNTTVCTTAAECPWSNGINERHNAILENMASKVMSDTGCSLDIAVSWAVPSKNVPANVYGYSHNQLTFGRNPNFPMILIDKLPALETATHCDIVLKNLTAMQAARRAFIESEANER